MKVYSLLLAIALLISPLCHSQEFYGIPIDGNVSTFMAKLKAKNFTFRKYVETTAIMDGKVGTQSVEVFIFSTPTTKKVYRISVYFPKKTAWYSLKANYVDLVRSLTEKYGESERTLESFDTPYYEGDGYEMSAVELDKANYASLWNLPNLTLFIEITKFKQVRITYENVKNNDLNKSEETRVNNNIL